MSGTGLAMKAFTQESLMRQSILIVLVSSAAAIACASPPTSNGASPFSGSWEAGTTPPIGGSPGTPPTLNGVADAALPLPSAPLGAFCQGTAPITATTGGTPLCSGDLAKKAFSFALCSCTDIRFGGQLKTDSMASTIASSAHMANVGANGRTWIGDEFDVDGALWSSATNQDHAFDLGDTGHVATRLMAGSRLNAGGTYTIDGDGYVAGDAIVGGSMKLGGRLHVSPGARVSGVDAAGGKTEEAVHVAEPCDCGNPLDIKSIVTSYSSQNDNGAAGVLSHQLNGTANATVSLPCGRYYFDRINVGGFLTIKATGRVAIFTDEDVEVGGNFQIELAPGAEVDVFAARNFRFGGSLAFGAPDHPGNVRVYVGGESVAMGGKMAMAANLYAPNAQVSIGDTLEVWGSLFMKRFDFGGNLTVHYDPSVAAKAPAGCGPSASGDAGSGGVPSTPSDAGAGGHTCSTPGDCTQGMGCTDGYCGACQTDSECSAPYVCRAGTCTSVVIK